jgi:hypothetical protein
MIQLWWKRQHHSLQAGEMEEELARIPCNMTSGEYTQASEVCPELFSQGAADPLRFCAMKTFDAKVMDVWLILTSCASLHF